MEYSFKKDLSTNTVSLRWMTANCYEIRLPGGKTIVTDPFLPPMEGGNPAWARYSSGLTADDLEGCDYVLVGHPHGDHVGSLPEVFDRFHPRVLCHSAYAVLMSEDLRIPQQMVFPYENNQTFVFEDFTLTTANSRHSFGPKAFVRPEKIDVPDVGTPFERLNMYGPMFNTNFIITTRNNLKIGFCAGTFEYEERKRWENAGINVLLRQCGSLIKNGDYEQMAQDIMDSHAELCLPLHHEGAYGKLDIIAFTDQVNEVLKARGSAARMFMPQRNCWYELGLSISLK